MAEYTLGQQIILNRWKLMADSDLGYMVQPAAKDIHAFFSKAFELVNFYGQYIQLDSNPYSEALPALSGFSICNGEEYLNVVGTLDLHYISINEASSTLEYLDSWLMMDRGWRDRYLYAREINGLDKKKKRR